MDANEGRRAAIRAGASLAIVLRAMSRCTYDEATGAFKRDAYMSQSLSVSSQTSNQFDSGDEAEVVRSPSPATSLTESALATSTAASVLPAPSLLSKSTSALDDERESVSRREVSERGRLSPMTHRQRSTRRPRCPCGRQGSCRHRRTKSSPSLHMQ
jgi:hypothetical protein